MEPNFNLAKNKSGYWEIRWSERDADAGRSRSRSQSCGTKNKREAQSYLEIWKAQRAALEDMVVGQTVGGIIDAYVARHVGRNCSSPTNDFSLRHVRRWFADHDVGEITPDELEAYRAYREKSVKSATVRKDLSALRAALRWAAHPARKMIDAGDIPHIELPADSAPRREFLDAEEAERLFDAARVRATGNDYFARRRIGLFVCLALETAAREGAIRGLTWDRVDLNRGLIDFRDPDVRVTRKRRVPVPVSKKLLPVLRDAWARRHEADDPGLVLGHNGKVRGAFKRLCKDVGLDGVNVHDLRRTWATLRVMWGVPMSEVAAILGDTLEVTEKHYAHYQPGFGRGAVDAVAPGVAAE